MAAAAAPNVKMQEVKDITRIEYVCRAPPLLHGLHLPSRSGARRSGRHSGGAVRTAEPQLAAAPPATTAALLCPDNEHVEDDAYNS